MSEPESIAWIITLLISTFFVSERVHSIFYRKEPQDTWVVAFIAFMFLFDLLFLSPFL